MLRMVLLRHWDPRRGEPEGGAGGEWHYDWMVERRIGEDPDERALLSFRVGVHPGEAAMVGGRFRATRIGDHRRLYLTFEGDLGTGGRGGVGRVERVASGRVSRLAEGGMRIEIEGAFDRVGGGVFRWTGEARTEDEWEFVTGSLAS